MGTMDIVLEWGFPDPDGKGTGNMAPEMRNPISNRNIFPGAASSEKSREPIRNR